VNPGYQLLQVLRVNRIMQALQDIRDEPGKLVFLNRTPVVPAVDEEIMARFIGRVLVADLVADDAQALTYNSGKFTFETTEVPNLKLGINMTQSMINQWWAIANGVPTTNLGIFTNFQQGQIERLNLGVRQRMEALLVAMACDGFSYNRLGIQMTGVTWGMPAVLKIAVATGWDLLSAVPVSDILLAKRTAKVMFGEDYNRATMSTAAFNYMTLTTDFQNRARYYLPAGLSAAQLPSQATEEILPVALKVLGLLDIELYDDRYWSQGSDGSLVSAPYLPITKVILDDRRDDMDPTVKDFANGVVTESIVASMGPTSTVGTFSGPARGPLGYATIKPDLNPPGVTHWGVARGFPRKHRLQQNACLTVGTFTDPIPVGESF